MSQSKNRKKLFNYAYGIGASIVILGALFKIQHWPGGSEMLTIGMVVEAIVFFVSAFDSVEEDLDWTLIYPELAGGDRREKESGQAKEAQGLLEMKISKLEEVVANARLIDESQLDLSKVLVLSTVKIKNQANGMEMKYTLVAESEADLKSGKISVTSPIGKGLLGKSVGEVAEIIVPNGVLKFDVLEITRD